MSLHEAKVVEIKKLGKHPNADSLSITHIDGWQVVIRTDDWKIGDLGVYITPDTLVKTIKPEFSFLAKDGRTQERVKAVKLRGIWSQGLLIPAPEGAKIGDDLYEALELEHYEPKLPISSGGDNEPGPIGVFPKYNIESFNRYPNVITENEVVVITEKIHGGNARFIYQDGKIYAGSRANWKKYNPMNLWWRAIEQNQWIEKWCKVNEGLCLYGEVFGQVQDLKYGAGKNDIFFRAFDIWNKSEWIDQVTIDEMGDNKPDWVPILWHGFFDEKMARELAEGKSTIADHHREGIVIKPITEKWDESLGRVILKIVGNKYLSRKDRK